MPWELITKAVVAGLLASVACGLGVVFVMIPRVDPKRHTGLAYAAAGGLMFAASVYNLILPSLVGNDYEMTASEVLPVLAGILLGAGFLAGVNRFMASRDFGGSTYALWGGKAGMLIFIAMAVHSIPEGVAVGVGFASGELESSRLGSYIALAIAIHNVPEGLAVAIPMRASGASFARCFSAAFLTSLPQPIFAIPAVLVSWFFQPIIPVLMGFAAGAMIFLILLELLPDALSTEKPEHVAWAFVGGFCAMLLIQIVL